MHIALSFEQKKGMRVVIQRVEQAAVVVSSETVGKIGVGLLVLVGIETSDTEEDALWLSAKILSLRIFDDENQVPNLSLIQINGEILLVSQFTLHALTKKGNRPSYTRAANPDYARNLYNFFTQELQKNLEKPIARGIFGADMKVHLINDGPLTIIIDSKNKE
jgi:D-tyrosyl-tRNA(Tyr) deacylase